MTLDQCIALFSATVSFVGLVFVGFPCLRGGDAKRRAAICVEDKESNDRALVEGTRILSAYQAANGTKFWIITEADRSVTTLLLPEDY